MDTGHPSRRAFLRATALALVGLGAGARLARAAGPEDEPGEEVMKVIRARIGDRPLGKGHVTIDLPEVAPDSREVPIFIETDLPMSTDRYVKALHLIVDHNPDIYLAGFQLTPALGAATIDTRIKMRRSSAVRVIAQMNSGELWMASKFVFTTLNGCV